MRTGLHGRTRVDGRAAPGALQSGRTIKMTVRPCFGSLPLVRSDRPITARRVAADVAAPAAEKAKAPAKGFKPEQYSKAKLGAELPKEYENYLPNSEKPRRAGVILHPTSLPGPYGIGELGSEARKFVDWLESAGLTCWQMLPICPPDPMFWSPYSGTDANTGFPMLISVDDLVAEGLVDEKDKPPTVPIADVDYPSVVAAKNPVLGFAAARLLNDKKFADLKKEMEAFRKNNPWIEDSAMFEVARNLEGLNMCAWWDWPVDFRKRKPAALAEFQKEHKDAIDTYVAIQFFFDRQWKALKKYANSKSIDIIGDMPIYVGGHSADVWANQDLFEVDEATGVPTLVSGVPPDAFSETGQLWGSPLYKWDKHKAEGYKWWCQRMARALELYDETRIDHFRGFAGYWQVAGDAETAMDGKWIKGPGTDLFEALNKKLGKVPILAEDLGVITQDVNELRQAIGAPGMVVLQFGWGSGPNNVHLPHNHYKNSFCYAGTHDNETAVGWYHGSAGPADKEYIQKYYSTNGQDIAWVFITSCMKSVADTSIFLMQDVLRLDNSARMNSPGKAAGNWGWRMSNSWEGLQNEAQNLRWLAGISNRLPAKAAKDFKM